MNKNATTSRQPDPNDLHDPYITGVASTFPHQEAYGMSNAREGFGFQNLLATQGFAQDDPSMYSEFNYNQGYAGVAGDNEEEYDGSDEVE